MIISDTVLSDEAVYYCGTTAPYPVFGVGTFLVVKDVNKFTTASEISEPHLTDDSVAGRPTADRNNTNMTTLEKTTSDSSLDSTVFGLGMTLGFSGILIVFLICSILRRQECENCKIKPSKADQSEERSTGALESHDMENYAALQFQKRNECVRTRDTPECVYSGVR
ncbi:uncharacterized protein LOC143526488 [Brachyhypopomus gauderio]|uniref:uncharacterized protein LOC143526488 n=1 Tax=Brachyhypopomus gauderio TaxID=698409 RepID=UPI0040434F3F